MASAIASVPYLLTELHKWSQTEWANFGRALYRNAQLTLIRKRHPIYRSEHPKWYSLGVASNATRLKQCLCYIQQTRDKSVRDFAPCCLDDVFVHSRAIDGQKDMEAHRQCVRKALTLMREHKLYANLKKCIFAKYHFLVAPWVSMASGPIRNRLTGRCLQMSRYFENSLA